MNNFIWVSNTMPKLKKKMIKFHKNVQTDGRRDGEEAQAITYRNLLQVLMLKVNFTGTENGDKLIQS